MERTQIHSHLVLHWHNYTDGEILTLSPNTCGGRENAEVILRHNIQYIANSKHKQTLTENLKNEAKEKESNKHL